MIVHARRSIALIIVGLVLVWLCVSATAPPEDGGGRDHATLVALINASAPTNGLFAGQFCGGVLLSHSKVLTAAHCVENRLPETVDVVAGVNDLCSGGPKAARVRVRQIRILDDSQGSDEAILSLGGPGVHIAPARLRRSNSGLDRIYVYGWGRDQDGRPTCSARKHELVVSSPTECESVFGKPARLVLCALPADGFANTCSWDSGSPAYDELGNAVAIVSAGLGCGPDALGSYSRINLGAINSLGSD